MFNSYPIVTILYNIHVYLFPDWNPTDRALPDNNHFFFLLSDLYKWYKTMF